MVYFFCFLKLEVKPWCKQNKTKHCFLPSLFVIPVHFVLFPDNIRLPINGEPFPVSLEASNYREPVVIVIYLAVYIILVLVIFIPWKLFFFFLSEWLILGLASNGSKWNLFSVPFRFRWHCLFCNCFLRAKFVYHFRVNYVFLRKKNC